VAKQSCRCVLFFCTFFILGPFPCAVPARCSVYAARKALLRFFCQQAHHDLDGRASSSNATLSLSIRSSSRRHPAAPNCGRSLSSVNCSTEADH